MQASSAATITTIATIGTGTIIGAAAPSVRSTSDSKSRRRSFVDTVHALAADLRGHANHHPKSPLGRVASACRSVDSLALSKASKAASRSSAHVSRSSMPPAKKPIVTFQLSSTSFLETTIADNLLCQKLYTIETADGRTTIEREDAVQGLTRIGSIYWQGDNADEKIPFSLRSDATIHMMNGRRRLVDDFLKYNKILGCRRFSIPHYPHTLRWKRSGRIFALTSSKFKTPIATLEPAILSAPARIKVFETLYEPDETRPQLEHLGIPVVLLDYLVVTALLLVTERDEWEHVGRGASTNASGPSLPTFRSDADDAVDSWRLDVPADFMTSRSSSPVLSLDHSGTTLSSTLTDPEGNPLSRTSTRLSFHSLSTRFSESHPVSSSSSPEPKRFALKRASRTVSEPATMTFAMSMNPSASAHPFAHNFDNTAEDDADIMSSCEQFVRTLPSARGEVCATSVESAVNKALSRARSVEQRVVSGIAPNKSGGSSQTSHRHASTSSAPLPQRSVSTGSSSLRRPFRPLPRPPVLPDGVPPVPPIPRDKLSLFALSVDTSSPVVSSPTSMATSVPFSEFQTGASSSTATSVGRSDTVQGSLRRVASEASLASPKQFTEYPSALPSSSSSKPIPNHSFNVHTMFSQDCPPAERVNSMPLPNLPTSSRHPLPVTAPLRIRNLTDNGADALNSPSYFFSPPVYPPSPHTPESSLGHAMERECAVPPPAYDSIDFSRP